MFIPHHRYPQPFYHFYPRYWLGYGIYLGYPVPWPYWYGYPEYVYGGGEIVTLPIPAAASYGGISFEITPDTATVIVDGTEVGMARDFAPTEQPLALTPGRHHIVLVAPGLEPLAFDVDIEAGQVVPFSGVLQPR